MKLIERSSFNNKLFNSLITPYFDKAKSELINMRVNSNLTKLNNFNNFSILCKTAIQKFILHHAENIIKNWCITNQCTYDTLQIDKWYINVCIRDIDNTAQLQNHIKQTFKKLLGNSYDQLISIIEYKSNEFVIASINPINAIQDKIVDLHLIMIQKINELLQKQLTSLIKNNNNYVIDSYDLFSINTSKSIDRVVTTAKATINYTDANKTTSYAVLLLTFAVNRLSLSTQCTLEAEDYGVSSMLAVRKYDRKSLKELLSAIDFSIRCHKNMTDLTERVVSHTTEEHFKKVINTIFDTYSKQLQSFKITSILKDFPKIPSSSILVNNYISAIFDSIIKLIKNYSLQSFKANCINDIHKHTNMLVLEITEHMDETEQVKLKDIISEKIKKLFGLTDREYQLVFDSYTCSTYLDFKLLNVTELYNIIDDYHFNISCYQAAVKKLGELMAQGESTGLYKIVENFTANGYNHYARIKLTQTAIEITLTFFSSVGNLAAYFDNDIKACDKNKQSLISFIKSLCK